MIDLSLYSKFERDIQSKNTSIYPLLIIGEFSDNQDDYIAISTVKEVIPLFDSVSTPGLIQFQDLDLKISNIKQSLNVENRTFKISNLSLTLSNYINGDSRLSDSLSKYINKNVTVYYKTPSCKVLTECLPIYSGSLKLFDFDDKKIKLTLEDKTQSKFHKDVPIANLGVSSNIYNKDYVNAYLPILYGEVNKAPAIAYKATNDVNSELYLLADNVIGINQDIDTKNIEIKGFGRSGNRPEKILGLILIALYISIRMFIIMYFLGL